MTKGIIAGIAICLMLALGGVARGQDQLQAKESAFKAAFLFRFIDYIDWKNNSESSTFNIAVLGNSEVTKQLQIIAEDQKAKNKKMNVKAYATLDDIDFCYILFVPADCPSTIESIVSKYAGKPVLIVSEKEDYSKRGSHINFTVADNKLKFEINLKKVDRSGIKISSQLLQHAIIIED